tara:strand:- start:20 stop:526 length:507 start_codon:yes stop_codon:yes gene_type:complete
MRRYLVLLLITGAVRAQTDFDKLVPVIDYENLSIKNKAIYDAKKDARNWILYTPAAFSIFVSSIYGTMINDNEYPFESFPATLGRISASLTIPYLLLRALTSKNTENFNSKDKQLYEKVYFEEYRKRKYKNIIISTGATALIAGAVIFHALSNLSFGDEYDVCFDPRC